MAKEIKQKIVLEGEREYNNAIKDAQRNLRTLRSELKAETAEMGKNATEQDKAAAKAKSLKEQIKEQETIVRTLRDALEEVKEKYGDNADEVARWEQRLNNARATLGNMRSDLEGVGGGFRNISTDAAAATVATKSVADTLESLGNVGSSISGAIENIFTKMIDTVTGAVGQLWDLISQTAAKANNWTDIASYWGTDAQTIQQYASSVSAAAGSFEDLNGIVSKIVMGGKGKEITELLGISSVNYKTDWDYAMAVMERMSQLTAQGKDMTPIYEQIFGEKKSQKVMWMVNNWQHIKEMLPEFSSEGFGMSDEGLETMNQLWLKINEVEEKWDGLKRKVAEGFGKVALDLLVNVEGTLEGFADYLNADSEEERQAALDKIRKNIEEFFTKLAGIVTDAIKILNDVGTELQNSDDPVTRAIGDILVGLTDALQWMIDNQEAVKAAFEAIFGVWLIGKLMAVAGKLASIMASIKVLQGFGLFGGAATSASALANGATGAGASAAGSAAGGAGLGAMLSNMLWSVGPIAAVLGLATIPAAMMDNADKERRHAELQQTQAAATAAAANLGENSAANAALSIVNSAVGAMDYTGEKNILGQMIMGRQTDIENALAEAEAINADAQVLSSRTALSLEYANRTGLAAMQEYELLDRVMDESAAWLENGGGPESEPLTIETLSDILDAVDEIRTEGDPNGEAMYRLIDMIIDNPEMLALFDDETRMLIGRYLDPESGFGVGSNTRYSDAKELLEAMMPTLSGEFWNMDGVIYPTNEGAAAWEAEAGDTGERMPGRRLRDEVGPLSDAMDAISEVLEEDLTGEGMYSLIDSIIGNPALTGMISEEMQAMIARYLDPESGFGVGSNTRYSDAKELLTALYGEFDAAYWARSNDTRVLDRPGDETQGTPGEYGTLVRPGSGRVAEAGDGGTARTPRTYVPIELPGMTAQTRPGDKGMIMPEDWQYLSNRTALMMRYHSIAGMTDMQENELLATAMHEIRDQVGTAMDEGADVVELLSDTLDAITELEEDPTGESMYQLLDSIIDNPLITGKLSEDMLTRLGEYMDPQSGFGVGSPTRYTDAQQLLAELYGELDAAYWDAVDGGEGTGNAILDRLDQLITVTDNGGDWSGPKGVLLRTLEADLWRNGGSGSGGGEGLTGEDLQGFMGLPAQILAAVKSGASAGVSGIRVSLDGYTVGQLVAPYVSQQIARDLPM